MAQRSQRYAAVSVSAAQPPGGSLYILGSSATMQDGAAWSSGVPTKPHRRELASLPGAGAGMCYL